MRDTRFLTALTLSSLSPISLAAQSVTPVPIPVPHSVVSIAAAPHLELSPHLAFPLTLGD